MGLIIRGVGTTSSRLRDWCATFPRVARCSQPWALLQNPFGILARMPVLRSRKAPRRRAHPGAAVTAPLHIDKSTKVPKRPDHFGGRSAYFYCSLSDLICRQTGWPVSSGASTWRRCRWLRSLGSVDSLKSTGPRQDKQRSLIRRWAPPSPHRMGRRNFSVGPLPGMAAWRPYPGLHSRTPLGSIRWRQGREEKSGADEFLIAP